MASSTYRSSNDRGRARGIILALIVEGLVALLLLQLGTGVFTPPKRDQSLKTFEVPPDAPAVGPKPTQRTRKPTKQREAASTTSPAPPTPVAPPPVVTPTRPQFIELSRDEFAASDIGKIPSSKGSGDSEGTGKDSVAAYGPGQGPGGAALYNAEWYREPTRAELATYLPPGVQSGYGLIACKTIEDYHVENCRSLGESPPGSGLSRALRLAAWQFRVRPPRIGGKPMIGAWVRIRFDLTVGVKDN
jgi:hypothetical protein